MNQSGILIIDKPAQWTSHDVVAKLRGVLKQKRIGHGGTLDPMATGVLPIFVGRATRAASFCTDADKQYIAGLRLGIVTDTQDITGTVISKSDAPVTISELRVILPSFIGKQPQIPPMYSAIKQGGKKLYELARQGIDALRTARYIEVSAIELIDKPLDAHGDNSFAYLRISCSKGTYIRTLCHDIGAALGCGATLSYLRRTRTGVFTLEDAHTLDAVQSAALSDTVSDMLLPIWHMFSQYPSATLDDADTQKAKNGALLRTNGIADGTYRFYSQSGEFLLLGEVTGDKLKVIKNFFCVNNCHSVGT